MDRSSERYQQNQEHNDDDIEDFESESQPRILTSLCSPVIKAPLPSQQRALPAARLTPKLQQGIPPQSSGKRKGFYDGIDPDLFALADVNEGSGTKKKAKMKFMSRDSLSTFWGGSGRAAEHDVTSVKTGKGLPAPESVQRQEPFEFSTLTPQVQPNKSRGFTIDPDLLAAASPVKVKRQSQRPITGRKPPIPRAIVAHDSSSKILWPTAPLPATSQRITKYDLAPSDDMVPETSPPPSAAAPPCQTLPLLNDGSQSSIVDSIEGRASPRGSEYHRPKPEDLDILHSDIDITSSPPLSPLSYHSLKSQHTDDASASGDSIPDPDLMTLNDPGTPFPLHKRLLKELKQQPPATHTPQTPRPGYFNIHDLQKSIVVPKTDSPHPPHQQHRWYSPGGLADTILGWKEELHGTSVFKQKIQPVGAEYIITITEVIHDSDMILIKGQGEKGVVRIIISGPVRLRLKVIAGQVVKYGRPWVVVNLLEEEWRCLMGKIEVLERDVDVDMG